MKTVVYTEQDVADTLQRSGVSFKALVAEGEGGFRLTARAVNEGQAAATRLVLRQIFANAANVTVEHGFVVLPLTGVLDADDAAEGQGAETSEGQGAEYPEGQPGGQGEAVVVNAALLARVRAAAQGVNDANEEHDAHPDDRSGEYGMAVAAAIDVYDTTVTADVVLALLDEIEGLRREVVLGRERQAGLEAEARITRTRDERPDAGHMPESAVNLDDANLIDHVRDLERYVPEGPWYGRYINSRGRPYSLYEVPGVQWTDDASGALQSFIASSRTLLPLLADRLEARLLAEETAKDDARSQSGS